MHIGHIGRIETAQVSAQQVGAEVEHLAHVGHIARVETAQVKARQPIAGSEHILHIGHLGRVEMAHINARQCYTAIEHFTHIGHLAGVQVTESCNGPEIFHITKPCRCTRRAGIGERGVKDHVSHLFDDWVI